MKLSFCPHQGTIQRQSSSRLAMQAVSVCVEVDVPAIRGCLHVLEVIVVQGGGGLRAKRVPLGEEGGQPNVCTLTGGFYFSNNR